MEQVVVGSTDAVLAEVRNLVDSLIAPAAAELDRQSVFPEPQLRALGKVGALGLMVGPEHGGSGAGLSALAAACELIGGACASTGMVLLMHSVAAATVAGGGGPRSPELLTSMARGESLGTLAFSERGTGAHFYAPELKAEQRGGVVRVSGRKSFVTSGGHADVMLVLVRGSGEGLDCYAIERSADGVSFDGQLGRARDARQLEHRGAVRRCRG